MRIFPLFIRKVLGGTAQFSVNQVPTVKQGVVLQMAIPPLHRIGAALTRVVGTFIPAAQKPGVLQSTRVVDATSKAAQNLAVAQSTVNSGTSASAQTQKPGVLVSVRNVLIAVASQAQKPAVLQTTVNSGSPSKPLLRPGSLLTGRNSGTSKPQQTPGGRIVHVKFDLTHRSGANAASQTSHQENEGDPARSDWANIANAQGTHDASNATIDGSSLGARGGRLVLDWPAFVDKSALTITSVKLFFYCSQSGTSLNNGHMILSWRKSTGDGWNTLEVFTGNFDATGTPKQYDITSGIAGSWTNLDNLQASIAFYAQTAELIAGRCDAIEVEVIATGTFA